MLGATQQRWRPALAVSKQPSYTGFTDTVVRHDLQSFVALPHSDRIHRFLAYWLSLRDDNRFPNRRSLDPLAIPSVLTGIWLITAETEDDRFVTKLSGESVNRFFGRSMAGHDVAKVYPEPTMASVLAQLQRVRDAGCLVLEQGGLVRPDGAVVHGERLFAPFSSQSDGIDPVVNHIVGVTIASGPVSQMKSDVPVPESQLFEAPVF